MSYLVQISWVFFQTIRGHHIIQLNQFPLWNSFLAMQHQSLLLKLYQNHADWGGRIDQQRIVLRYFFICPILSKFGMLLGNFLFFSMILWTKTNTIHNHHMQKWHFFYRLLTFLLLWWFDWCGSRSRLCSRLWWRCHSAWRGRVGNIHRTSSSIWGFPFISTGVVTFRFWSC